MNGLKTARPSAAKKGGEIALIKNKGKPINQQRISNKATLEIFDNYEEISSNILEILEKFDGDMLEKIWFVFCYGVAYGQELSSKEISSNEFWRQKMQERCVDLYDLITTEKSTETREIFE